MRWLGLALVLVAGLFLAWDSFGLKAQPMGAKAHRSTTRIISGIGITTGFLLIVVGTRRFDPD